MSDLSPMLDLMADDPARRRPRPVRRRLQSLLEALGGTSYAVCGAVAMGAHGVRRFTEDIDVLVAERDLQPVLAELHSAYRELGRQPEEGPPAPVRLRSRRAHGPEGVDIDLLVPIDGLETWALRTAVNKRAFGRGLRVVSVEALVCMKLAAYASDADSPETARHRADAARLMRETHVDLAELRNFLADHPLLHELERLLSAPPPAGRRRPR